MDLTQIRIVLVNTSHSGNIGAAARVMKNMGLSQLVLVAPKDFPSAEATARASGADDILAQAIVCETLEEAIAPCEQVFATSARERHLPWPLCTPRECVAQIQSKGWARVAIVFGHERSGLSNDQLALAHQHVHIPTVESFSSLNLAQAVGVIAYELGLCREQAAAKVSEERERVTAGELQGLIDHFETIMTEVGFLNPDHPKLLMRRLRRLYHRAELDKTELNILRGLLSAVGHKLH